MQHKLLLFTLLLTLCLVTGCSQATQISEAAQDNTDTVEIHANTVTPTGALESIPTIAALAETVETVPDATATEETATPKEPDYCSGCHMDKQMLIDTAKPQEDIVVENEGEGWGGEVAPLEPWEKVLIDSEEFPRTTHALIGCIECHSGTQRASKDDAHEGLVADPSADYEKACARCHPDVVPHIDESLHTTLAGYWYSLDARSVPSKHPALEEAFENHCVNCHATCGDCHVSQPNSVGGGFIDGHNFNSTPSMTRNCTACHGSRIGNEYLGKHEGLLGDVHFRQARMSCLDCHSGESMHGIPRDCNNCHAGPEVEEIPPQDHRYGGIQAPRCETCHTEVTAGDDVLMHEMHGGKLSCQVCHSVAYTSCDGCHVALSEETGNPFFKTEASYLTFLIGRNPLQSYERPYEYVPVRHVPISQTSFEFYGTDLLPGFDQMETWKYTTPHNIQRETPQTESCTNCHGSAEYFLTADKIKPEELDANREVIVEEVPPPFTSELLR